MNKKDIRQKIIELTNERYPKTICPSEVLPSEQKQDKEKMNLVRQIACELVEEGKIVIMQKQEIIDHKNIKGPIRLKKNSPLT